MQYFLIQLTTDVELWNKIFITVFVTNSNLPSSGYIIISMELASSFFKLHSLLSQFWRWWMNRKVTLASNAWLFCIALAGIANSSCFLLSIDQDKHNFFRISKLQLGFSPFILWVCIRGVNQDFATCSLLLQIVQSLTGGFPRKHCSACTYLYY